MLRIICTINEDAQDSVTMTELTADVSITFMCKQGGSFVINNHEYLCN